MLQSNHFLRLLAEWIERAILLQVGLQRFFIRLRLELMNHLLNCFLGDMNLLLNSRMGQFLDLKSVSGRQLSVCVPPPQSSLYLLEWSKDVRASELVVTWRP